MQTDSRRRRRHGFAPPSELLDELADLNEEGTARHMDAERLHDLPAPRTWPAWVLAWVALVVLWMPAMRGLAWGVLWVAYATGTSSEPPPAYTAWAP